jgi:hypothetical protein
MSGVLVQQRRLTLRSSGEPTARRQARAAPLRLSCTARACRHAAGSRLAQTLGSAGNSVQRSSRVSACRRELSSHNAEQPRLSASSWPSERPREGQRPHTLPHLAAPCFGRTGANDLAVLCSLERLRCGVAVRSRHVLGATCGAGGLNATRIATAPRLSRGNSSTSARAPARRRTRQAKPPSTALPNPSVKRHAVVARLPQTLGSTIHSLHSAARNEQPKPRNARVLRSSGTAPYQGPC